MDNRLMAGQTTRKCTGNASCHLLSAAETYKPLKSTYTLPC